MKQNKKNISGLFLLLLTLGDLALVGASYGLGWWLRFRTPWMGAYPAGLDNPRAYWYATPLVLGTFWLVFRYLGLYKSRRGISSVDEFSRLFNGSLFSLLLLSGVAFFIREFHFSIKVFLTAAALTLLSLLIWRTLMRIAQIRARQRGLGVVKTIIVGSGAMAAKLVERVRANPGLGYRLVGLVDDGAAPRKVARKLGLPYLGAIKHLGELASQAGADCVIVALPASMHDKTHRILLDFDRGGIELRIVSDLYGFITSPVAVDEIHGIPVFALKEAPLDRLANRALKRAFDLCLLIPGLLLISPLLAAIAVVIKLDSKGPVFFRQERVGLNNERFTMLKFRTMRVETETAIPGWTVKDDPRRTRSGPFLRKSSMDELPQLFNVLSGKMSLVGPRPEMTYYAQKWQKNIPRYIQRHQVKTGITGWAQVHGWRGDTSIEERVAFDLYYVENWSLSLDFLILGRTLLELFDHETAY